MNIGDALTLGLIEDDDDVRTALGRLLRSMGHRVLAFPSAEAFDADPADFDCLIIDVRLPGMSGPELSERIRGRGSRLPTVFITGDSDSPGRTLAIDSSAPLLGKPFSDDQLIDAVARAIRMSDTPYCAPEPS